MYDRFTKQVNNVIDLAYLETQHFGHKEIATVHLLLGLIRQEQGLAAQVLRDARVKLENARLEVEKIQRRGQGYYTEIPYNQHTIGVFELSKAEADQLKDSEIDTEHLLLGLLRHSQGGAIRVLQNLGVDPTQLRNQVFRKLVKQGHPTASQFLPNSTPVNPNGTNPNNAHLTLIQKILQHPEGSDAEFVKNNPGIIDPELIESMASILEQQGDAKGGQVLRGLIVPRIEETANNPETPPINVSEFVQMSTPSEVLVTESESMELSPPPEDLEPISSPPEVLVTESESMELSPEEEESIQISNPPEVLVTESESIELPAPPEELEPVVDIPTPSNQELEKFLYQLLRVSLESKGNEQVEVVHNFLRENLDKLSDRFPEVLQNWADTTFPRLKDSQKQELLKRITFISSVIRKFDGGVRGTNLEIALTGYNIVASILTPVKTPEYWAIIHKCLALTYLDRVQGERGENLKEAIAYFKVALDFYNQEQFPEQRKIILENVKQAETELRNILGKKEEENEEQEIVPSSNLSSSSEMLESNQVRSEVIPEPEGRGFFQRFNEKAIKAIMLAQEESRRMGHNFVGTEQIFLGLIGEATDVAAQTLKSLGVNLKDARIEVEKIIGRGSGVVDAEIPVTPRARRVLELAVTEADQLGDQEITTKHLLLGLVREGEGVAVRVLENMGIDLSQIRSEIITQPQGGGFFQRFSEKAIKAIMLAQEESRRMGDNFVGIDKILLGLIGEGTGVAAQTLKFLGVNLKDARIEVQKIIGRGLRSGLEEIPFTPKAKRVLELAVTEADQLGDQEITTEHLLLSLVREEEGIAARVLKNMGVDLSQVRYQVLGIRKGGEFEGFSDQPIQGSILEKKEETITHQNPERSQQYLYLIEELLRSPQSQHETILDDNSELLDAGLIEMMRKRAEAEEKKGNIQNYELLITLTKELTEKLPLSDCFIEPSSTATEISLDNQPDSNSQESIVNRESLGTENNNNDQENDPQFQFLMQALQITQEGNGNPQLLYLLFQQNLDFLDDNLPQLLKKWATDTLAKIEPEAAQNLATLIGMFSELIQQFPLGIPAKQISIFQTSLVGFEIAETVFTKEAFPEKATQIQNHICQSFLALVFLHFSEIGTNQGNIESIYPILEANIDKLDGDFTEFLRNWITSAIPTQQNSAFTNQLFLLQSIATGVFVFSNVMKDFPEGDPETNLEIAIAGYESVINVFNRDNFPIEWGEIQNQLGQTYLKRQRGDRSLNLQQAIKHFLSSLKIYTPDEFPEQREMIEQNLNQAALEARQLGKENNEKFNPDELETIYENFAESIAELIFAGNTIEFTGNTTDELMSFFITNITTIDLENSSALIQKAFKRKAEEWIANLPEEAQEEGQSWIQKVSDAFSQYLAQNSHYYQFVERVVQVIIESNNDFGAVYSVLEDNLDKLDEQFISFLQGLDLTKYLSVDTLLAEGAGMGWSNFGFVLLGFPKGDHALNVEIAIAASEKVLELFTRNSFPVLWAKEQRNLANTYIFRVRGDKLDNLHRAIRHCENALEIINSIHLPDEWAKIVDTLGNTYSHLASIEGPQSQYVELAIEHYQNVRETFLSSSTAKIEDIVVNLNHLGNIYLDRAKGTKEENIEKAISYFKEAIELTTSDTYLQYWIKSQIHLANAYRQRIKGKKSDNFKQAISRYESVLQLETEKTFEWASTQLNLGVTYWELDSDQGESQEKAIDCYEKALTVYSQTDDPESWGLIQSNLGVIYKNRIEGDPDENMKLAITCYQNALEVRSRSDFPLYRAETLFNLGWAYQKIKQFMNAYNTLEEGIDIIEELRGKIVSGDEIKQKFAENWHQIYRIMVEVCLELAVNDSEYYIKALEYVERSKTRNLFELLAGRGVESTVIAEKFELVPIQEILKALDENTAIVEWYFTDNCFYTFILTSKKPKITVLKSSQKDFVEIYQWANLYYQSYRENNEDKNDWQSCLPNFFQELGRVLNFNHLINMIPANCEHLILIPHRFLHLLPLHAFPLQDGNCLLDYLSQIKRFAGGVSYAPSCQIWYKVKNRKTTNFSYLFAVQNPTLDLQYTDIEVEVIKEFFNDTEILNKENANKENIDSSRLQIANCVHFSCHGYFNFDEPLKSALILSKARVAEEQNLTHIKQINLRGSGSFDLQKCLTLEEIFNLNLTQCRLVTLSACETGLTDPKSVSDEYIGLPSSFLYAGASNVVATLWTVNDLSTTFLMIKFYENLYQQLKETNELNVAIALQNAQLWLKQVDKKQLGEWLPNISLRDINHETQLEDWLSEREPNIKLFESPYYWAGFCAIGQ